MIGDGPAARQAEPGRDVTGAGLAARQAELVAALTSGSPVPPGFDPRRVEVARVALLRKRAGEVAKQWPMLAAGFGTKWTREFATWAAARPTQGSLRDGWDLARELGDRLPSAAREELAVREAGFRYGGTDAPRARRFGVARVGPVVVVQVAGQARTVRR